MGRGREGVGFSFVDTKERGERTARNLTLVGNKTAGGSRSKFTHEAEKGFSRLGKATLYIVISLSLSFSIDTESELKNEYRERERERERGKIFRKLAFLILKY